MDKNTYKNKAQYKNEATLLFIFLSTLYKKYYFNLSQFHV